MKKRSIGEITRGGGFPAAIREVRESGEPVFITKGNESVAVLFPSSPEFERFMLQATGFLEVLRSLRRDGYAEEAIEFLVTQRALGVFANLILTVEGKGEVSQTLRDKLVSQLFPVSQLFTVKDRTEDRATVRTDLSAVPMEGKGRRRKSPASPKSPKQSPPPKR